MLYFLTGLRKAQGFLATSTKKSLKNSILSKTPSCEAPPLTVRWNSKLFGPDDSGESDDMDKQSEEGKDLAKQFYQQVRDREGSLPAAASSDTSYSAITNDDSKRRRSGAPAPPEKDETLEKKKKFTGEKSTDSLMAQPDPAPFGNNANSGFFRAGGNTNNDSASRRRSLREQMMEREFQLVGRAERGLKYQALLVVCLFVLYAYVGLTGGIANNSEQADGSFRNSGADELVIDEILPTPRDSEISYWL